MGQPVADSQHKSAGTRGKRSCPHTFPQGGQTGHAARRGKERARKAQDKDHGLPVYLFQFFPSFHPVFSVHTSRAPQSPRHETESCLRLIRQDGLHLFLESERFLVHSAEKACHPFPAEAQGETLQKALPQGGIGTVQDALQLKAHVFVPAEAGPLAGKSGCENPDVPVGPRGPAWPLS